jgi:hypothetical protein
MAAGSEVSDVIERLRAFWEGLRAEGLDRPFPKPEGRQPTVRDLELVCWELVVTPKMLEEMRASQPDDPVDSPAWNLDLAGRGRLL